MGGKVEPLTTLKLVPSAHIFWCSHSLVEIRRVFVGNGCTRSEMSHSILLGMYEPFHSSQSPNVETLDDRLVTVLKLMFLKMILRTFLGQKLDALPTKDA
ncbi:hypothetical protein AVEN_180620-1 [Araneus ventricosus]|uniref:Uncharacterized protein n=1 Tax=Araneus ventricosus TaxID=182803 RepID=A0A4Y2PGW0_ARAVE|nr:hypothetical protein AVEN_180620-1 [Araneus ventricosus]